MRWRIKSSVIFITSCFQLYTSTSGNITCSYTAKVVFTYDDNVLEVPVSEGVRDSGRYRYVCPISAREMAVEITCKVVYSTGESDEYVYSVQEYAETLINKGDSYGPELVNVMTSLLNYGTASQLYFGYNTDDLANDIDCMSDEDRVVAEIDFSDLTYSIEGETAGIKYYGSALSLKSSVGIKHYFVISDKVNVNKLNVTVDGESAELKKNGDLYELYISEVLPQNRYTDNEVKIGDFLTLSYSVMDYASIAQQVQDQELLDVLYAMAAYLKNIDEYWN